MSAYKKQLARVTDSPAYRQLLLMSELRSCDKVVSPTPPPIENEAEYRHWLRLRGEAIDLALSNSLNPEELRCHLSDHDLSAHLEHIWTHHFKIAGELPLETTERFHVLQQFLQNAK